MAEDLYSGNADTLYAHINRIRRNLDDLYDSEWRRKQQRVRIRCIGGGPLRSDISAYDLLVEKNKPPIRDPHEYFWGKFLSPNARNLLYLSEPLFFMKPGRHLGPHQNDEVEMEDCFYIRYPKVNLPSERPRFRGTISNLETWSPIVYYAKFSEVLSAFTLLHALTFRSALLPENGKTARGNRISEPLHLMAELTTPSMTPPPERMPRTNMIVFGNPRINEIFADQQASLDPQFYISPDNSKIYDRSTGERYRDVVVSRYDPLIRQQVREITTFGLLTYAHLATNDVGRTMLLIGGNFGPAMQGICQYITDREALEKILCPQLTSRNNVLADSFQVVFKVHVRIFEDGLIRIQNCVPERVIQGALSPQPSPESAHGRNRQRRTPRRGGGAEQHESGGTADHEGQKRDSGRNHGSDSMAGAHGFAGPSALLSSGGGVKVGSSKNGGERTYRIAK